MRKINNDEARSLYGGVSKKTLIKLAIYTAKKSVIPVIKDMVTKR